MTNITKIEQDKLKEIYEDPVKWAQVFLKTFNPRTKKLNHGQQDGIKYKC